MSSPQPTTSPHPDIEPLSAAEESKLDQAMRKADQILVASLQVDERRRRTRKLWLLLFGGLIMIAAGIVVLISLLGGDSDAKASADASKLSQEGWALWQKHDWSGAADKFEAATKADPKIANAWNGLGWAQFNGGQWDKGEEAFKKCLELSPKHPAALNGMGQICFARGKLDDAEKYLKQAADLNATASWWGLAKIYLLRSNWDEAQKWAQKIVDSGDTSAQPLLDAARNKKLDDALKQEITPPGAP